MRIMRIMPVAAVLLVISTGASSEYEYAGSGSNGAKVLVEFGDGAIFAFGVSFSDPSTTGVGLIGIIEADTTLTDQRVPYPPPLGDYIYALSYRGHSDADAWSEQTPEAYWHYWVPGPNGGWTSSGEGASSRVVTDGCADGWVYGDGNPPHLPGDVGGDLVVDTSDLTAMSANWMAPSGKTWADGDFNGDGAVDTGDLALMTANWMFGQALSPPPVPEPATLLVLAAGLAVLRRRRGC